MPRGPSPDPVHKVTVSLPRSLYEWAVARAAAARPPMTLSRYIQTLMAQEQDRSTQDDQLFQRLVDAAQDYKAAQNEAKEKAARKKHAA